jgi:hypothetical protein
MRLDMLLYTPPLVELGGISVFRPWKSLPHKPTPVPIDLKCLCMPFQEVSKCGACARLSERTMEAKPN